MNKEYLLKSALQLKHVSKEASDEYQKKSEELITNINSTMIARKDINMLIGENNMEMMKDNHANHVRFIASLLKNYNHEVLVNTVLWVFNAYTKHGFATNYWSAQLNVWMQIIPQLLTPATVKEILPYYEWMQINIPIFVKVAEQKPENLNIAH